ncbi:MAG TPA: RDD family protein [Longimicrobium sp.]|nr:RDD family protein [Longimicrobium sp.]
MPATDPSLDPRRLITQEAFSVAPQLLGLPLARPSRRLVAILLDLLIVTILVNVGGAVLFGVAAAFAFFRFASKALGKGGSFFGKSARFALRGAGTLILFGVAISTADSIGDAFSGDDDEPRRESDAGPVVVSAGGATTSGGVATAMAAFRTLGGIKDLHEATDTASARAATSRLVREMRGLGAGTAEIRKVADEAAAENGRAWIPGAVADLLPVDSSAAAPLPPESLAVRFAAARAEADTARADSLAARLGSVLARDSLDALRGEARDARRGEKEAEKALEEERERGVLARLLHLLDDLGLSFGWNALYFTAFTALWKGQTPGKRLLGIRVVRLNGQPMTLWSAFERFGGYAAGLLTGLLGFAQVYWDRNRQAIHDKITETVVIRDAGSGAPPPPPPQRPAPAWSAPPANPTTRVPDP